jgi:2-polyprenyl-3-methyl-5-hydroxy-6-metoxy-1,4-benzoquinol methylase
MDRDKQEYIDNIISISEIIVKTEKHHSVNGYLRYEINHGEDITNDHLEDKQFDLLIRSDLLHMHYDLEKYVTHCDNLIIHDIPLMIKQEKDEEKRKLLNKGLDYYKFARKRNKLYSEYFFKLYNKTQG